MRNLESITAASLALVFMMAGCAGPARQNVEKPAWADTVTMTSVAKRSCQVTNAKGELFNVSSAGVDIGDDLVASRTRRYCHVRNTQDNIKCTWNRNEQLTECTIPAQDAPK